MFVSLNYAADFVAPAPIVPFSFMTYEQVGEQTALEELKKVASECGVSSATCDVLSGAPPFDEICQARADSPCRSRCDADARTHRVETCFSWQHGGKNCAASRRVRFSSRAEALFRRTMVHDSGLKTILVPVDFSSCSREGLRYAIAFANEFGAKIILLHATYLGYVYSQ